MTKTYYIYMITNISNTLLYIGVTNNLERRMYEHKMKIADGYTKKYSLFKLVYFEESTNIESAILREKQLKRWHRDWKYNLIKSKNPGFVDLVENNYNYRALDPEINSG
jgi:putative endonuclease